MIKVLTESRKVFTDKDDYEIIVSANKRTTGCTITCFDNNGNPNSYYLERLYKDLMTQVVHLDQLNGILEVSAPFSKVIQSIKKIKGISEINESANPYWFVNYDYDGDELSNYQSTVLVQAKDEKSALARAKKLVPSKEPSARFFKIRDDKKLGKSTSLSTFQKTYPLSNYDILNESTDEMENEVTPVSPAVGTPVDTMQDIPAEATDATGKIAEEGDFKEHEIDYTDPKYQKIVDYLNNNGYPGSKFLGKMGFYIPQTTSYVSIIFNNIFAECSISTAHYQYLSTAAATEYMSELTKVIPVVDAINAILADATTAETKDRHVSESVDPDNDTSNGGD